MRRAISTIKFLFHSIRLVPHYLAFRLLINRQNPEAMKFIEDIAPFQKEGGFFRILFNRKEYITVLYNRLGIIGSALALLGPKKYPFFMLPSKDLGGGIYIDHPYYTFLHARKIGKNFKTKHNVTIGNNKGGIPVIGDNVFIAVGAVVVGDIKIGNNVFIGANTVVSHSVPDNCVVIGNPAKIVKQNGKHVDIPLR